MFDINDSASIAMAINQISRENGFGELSIANSLSLRGFNHRGLGNPISAPRDNQGINFWTRPNLNLSEGNLVAKRVLSILATGEEYSIQRLARALLDPRANWCEDMPAGAKRHNVSPISTPLVDRHNPFIPMFTNHVLSLTGWKDIDMDSYTSPEGKSRQTYSQIDSVAEILNSFTLTANFRNVTGDPITLLILVWLYYSGWVYRGDLLPYPESMVENEIDYQTRIYRFVLDPTRRFIQKFACTGIAYPTAISIGAAMNFNSEKPYSDENAQLTIPFQCTGAMYNDPIIIYWFNKTVYNFCDALRKSVGGESQDYVKIDADELAAYPYRGLPHINPYTLELEWWVPRAEAAAYNATKRGVPE